MAGWGGGGRGVDKGIMSYCLIITVWILLIKNKNFEHENYMLPGNCFFADGGMSMVTQVM